MRFPFHRNSAGVAARRVGITGLSAPVGAAALINAVIVVKMTLAIVAAWIAILVMLIIVVSVCAGVACSPSHLNGAMLNARAPADKKPKVFGCVGVCRRITCNIQTGLKSRVQTPTKSHKHDGN